MLFLLMFSSRLMTESVISYALLLVLSAVSTTKVKVIVLFSTKHVNLWNALAPADINNYLSVSMLAFSLFCTFTEIDFLIYCLKPS